MTAQEIVEALCDAQREAVFAANPTGPYDGHKYELAAAHRDAIKEALVDAIYDYQTECVRTGRVSSSLRKLEEACRG